MLLICVVLYLEIAESKCGNAQSALRWLQFQLERYWASLVIDVRSITHQ